MVIGNALSVGLIGLKAFLIQIQAFVSQGLPAFSIIGLPDASLSEARERVKSACQSLGYRWPETRITVNLSPASMPKHGSSYDLAIAASIASTQKIIPLEQLSHTLIVGELNLDGSVLPIHGLLPIALYAKAHGITRMIIPQANMSEAQLVPEIEAIGINHIQELVTQLGGTLPSKVSKRLPVVHVHTREEHTPVQHKPELDMAQVIGQEHTKWALQVAAAGGHHMMMIGPPGSGKTMLAQRLPSIMCPLNEEEQLEVASIRSLIGTLSHYGISDIPPFEAPHHTASSAALIGGGAGIAQPGIITRAHRGILFMDEAPEFSPKVLQTLREPLESGYVAVSRSKGTMFYPARFQLIIAANPCPCGKFYGTGEQCTCKEKERMRYFSRLSGPILDRIDIQIDVPVVEHINIDKDLSSTTASHVLTSAMMRKKVCQARQAAQERFRGLGWSCNAQASGEWLRKNTSTQAISLINNALEQHRLSLRGADRVLRLSWTLADLSGHTCAGINDVAQAISLRTRI